MKKYDLFVIGSGPAGQKAAIAAAKSGWRVALCEQLKEVGGACVQFGTIPSKTLRERALQRTKALREVAAIAPSFTPPSTGVTQLIGEMTAVVKAHDRYMSAQLKRNDVDIIHGRASFVHSHRVEVRFTNGQVDSFEASHVLIATGSIPRDVPNVAVDHEHIYDSDSVLSLAYLPQSMIVLGGGVIACEYASIFALLGVDVTLVDRYPSPLGFLDQDLTARFLQEFQSNGGHFIGGVTLDQVEFDGLSKVSTRLDNGVTLASDKVLCALGRVAQVSGLNLAAAGLELDERRLIPVDDVGCTQVPHIYAAGDVVGPPSLASASMEQGRRAACAMLGIDPGPAWSHTPSGIYSVPELSSVGMTEKQVVAEYGAAVVGKADFSEIARGLIADSPKGMLKLVASPDGRLRGVHIAGVQATELIHIGQAALLNNVAVTDFVENIFNFPTYAESYRVAALALVANLSKNANKTGGAAAVA